jgi:hypothetical protein
MMLKGKTTIACLVMLFFTVNEAMGQNLNRLSLNAGGGITWGHTSVVPAVGGIGGGSLEFGATRVFALKAEFRGGMLTSGGNDPYNRNYENALMQIGFGTHLYLMDAFEIKNRVVNPYLSFTGGLLVSELTLTDDDPAEHSRAYDDIDPYLNFGGGVKFKLGQRVDLFLHYDLNYPYTDYIDGYHKIDFNHITATDFFTVFTAGLSLKLGGADEHIAWHEPEDPLETAVRENSNELRQLKRDLAAVEEQTAQDDELRKDFNAFKNQVDRRFNEIIEGQDTLAQRVRETPRDRQPDRARERTREHTPGEYRSAEPGTFYIIAGSFSNSNNADALRNKYRDQGYNANVIYDPNNDLYRVAIDQSTDRNEARTKLERIRRDVENNAWIMAP